MFEKRDREQAEASKPAQAVAKRRQEVENMFNDLAVRFILMLHDLHAI